MLADPLGGLGHELCTSTCVFPSALLFLCVRLRAQPASPAWIIARVVYRLVECERDCRGTNAARIGNQEMRAGDDQLIASSMRWLPGRKRTNRGH